MPHWKSVAPWMVRDVFAAAMFEVIDPNVRCLSPSIPFPRSGSRIVIHNDLKRELSPVLAQASVFPVTDGQLFRQTTFAGRKEQLIKPR